MQTNLNSKKNLSLLSLGRIWSAFCLMFLISCSNLLPACDVCSSPPLTQLKGHWELLRWNRPADDRGRVTLRPLPHEPVGPPLSMEFNQAQKILSGFSGCNRFSATITTDKKEAVELSNFKTTKMGCASSTQNELENDFLNQLADYRSIHIKDNQLLLLGRSGDVLIFGKKALPSF